MAQNFYYLSSFAKKKFSLHDPHLLPLLFRPISDFLCSFHKRKFIHQDTVQTNSKTIDITFFIIHVIHSDKSIRKFLHFLFPHDEILNLWFYLLFFLLTPLVHFITTIKSPHSDLQSSCDKDILKLNEVNNSFLVHILHEKTYLSHNM